MFLRCTGWLPRVTTADTYYSSLTMSGPDPPPFADVTLLGRESAAPPIKGLEPVSLLLGPVTGSGQQNMTETRVASSQLDSCGCVCIWALSEHSLCHTSDPEPACLEAE